jgi:attachment p12 family protein
MGFGWQDLAALGIVLAAAGYLARNAWNAVTRKRGSGCGSGCGSCSARSAANSASPEEVVSIGLPGRVHRQGRESPAGPTVLAGKQSSMWVPAQPSMTDRQRRGTASQAD